MEEFRKIDEIGENPKTEDKDEKVEGYAYCESIQQKCLTDCIGGSAFLSEIN